MSLFNIRVADWLPDDTLLVYDPGLLRETQVTIDPTDGSVHATAVYDKPPSGVVFTVKADEQESNLDTHPGQADGKD